MFFPASQTSDPSPLCKTIVARFCLSLSPRAVLFLPSSPSEIDPIRTFVRSQNLLSSLSARFSQSSAVHLLIETVRDCRDTRESDAESQQVTLQTQKLSKIIFDIQTASSILLLAQALVSEPPKRIERILERRLWLHGPV